MASGKSKVSCKNETQSSSHHSRDHEQPVEDCEDKVIYKNLEHIQEFIGQLKLKDSDDLSDKTRNKVEEVKFMVNKWLEDSKQAKVDSFHESCQGARKKVFKREIPESISEKSSINDSSDSSDSGRDLYSAKSDRVNRMQWVKLEDVMGKIGGKKIPELEKFNEKSGEDLKKYLAKFEKYCSQNINGDRDGWVIELKEHLEGRTLEAFKVMKGVRDDYDSIKAKLLEWFSENKENRKRKYLRNFEKAKCKPNEELYLYCCKLENLYRLAYPKKNDMDNRMLQQKFLSSVPKEANKMMKTYRMFNRINDKKMKWSEMKRWAKLYDAEKEELDEEKKVSDTDSSQEEIVIDVGQKLLEKARKREEKQYGNRVYYSDRYRNSGGYQVDRKFDHQRGHNLNRNDGNGRYASGNANTFGGRRVESFNNNQGNGYNGDEFTYQSRRSNFHRGRGAYHTNRNYNNGNRAQFSAVPNSIRGTAVTCSFCGKIGHKAEVCRFNLKCFSCGGHGHMARVCPTKRVQNRFNRSASVDASGSRTPFNSRNADVVDGLGENVHNMQDNVVRNRHASGPVNISRNQGNE